MLFLNMGLLIGLAGISIPVLIHLFNRKSAKVTDWGAMHFLMESHVSSRRRVLIEEMLLLGSRCLLVALLTLALARPFIPAGSGVAWVIVLPLLLIGLAAFGASFALWRHPRMRRNTILVATALFLAAGLTVGLDKWLNLKHFGGRGGRDVVIIVDGSASMTMQINGKTNFDRAMEEAERTINQASRNTAFSLIVAGPAPGVRVPVPISDRKELLSVLAELKPVSGTMHILDALSAAGICLAQGYNPTKQVILFTDGQRAGWETDHPTRWAFLGKAFDVLPVRPQVILRTFDMPPQYRNAAIGAIRLSRSVVGSDREVSIVVDVVNTGTEAVTPSAVTLTIDDETPLQQAISQMVPGTTESLTFRHHFTREGSHSLLARVVVEDDLVGDDTDTHVLNVVPHLRVLIVDGNPASRFIERGGGFAALALAPTSQTGEPTLASSTEFLVEPNLLDFPNIRNVESFEEYDVVILADVPRLPESAASALAAYVQGGGGLLIAPGTRTQPVFYNAWRTAEAEPMLPATLVEAPGHGNDDDILTPALTTFSHPALRPLVEDGSDVADLRISTGWKLLPPKNDPEVTVGGRFNTGDPFLVERTVGKGIVLLMACSIDTHAGNLVTRQAFVPLIHEMVYHLSMPGMPSLNIAPGKEIAFQLPSRVSGDIAPTTRIEEADFACTGLDPAGQPREARMQRKEHSFFVRMAGDVMAGAYQLFAPEAFRPTLAWALNAEGTIPFTITRDVDECRLVPLLKTDRELLQQHIDLLATSTEEDVHSALSGKAFGEELWRTLAMAAFLLLIAEIALARRIAISRKTGSETPVDLEAERAPSKSFQSHLETLRGSYGS
jgi:hypothetical protein